MDRPRRRLRIAVGLATAAVLALALRLRRDGSSKSSTESEPNAPSESVEVEAEGMAAKRRLDAGEVQRQLTDILAAIQDSETRALQVLRILDSADLSDATVGAMIWDFATRHLEPGFNAMTAVEALGLRWVVADRSAAWAFLADPGRIPTGFESSLSSFQRTALRGALLGWVEWDRGEAFHLARTIPSVQHRPWLLIQLYRQWAETDPETASTEARTDSDLSEVERYGAVLFQLTVIDRKDPGLALRLARSIPREFWNSLESNMVLEGLFEWVRQTPDRAARFIGEIPGDTGWMLADYLVSHWTAKDPGAALEWALAHPGANGFTHDTAGILGALASRDPLAAVARWSRDTLEMQRSWAPELAAGWASQDPIAATAWAREQMERGLSMAALLRSTSQWAKGDPLAAAAFIRGVLPTIPDPADRLSLVRIWITAEPAPAMDSLRGLVSPENHDDLYAEILPTAVQADPAAAASALARILAPGLRQRVASRIGARWGAQNPEEAVGWARSATPGTEQESAVRSVYEGWAGANPDAAIASLLRLDSPLRDQARVGLVQALMNPSPARAADLSLQVSDPRLQSQLLESTFQRWMSSAPEAATTWLDAAAIPESLRSRLRALRRG